MLHAHRRQDGLTDKMGQNVQILHKCWVCFVTQTPTGRSQAGGEAIRQQCSGGYDTSHSNTLLENLQPPGRFVWEWMLDSASHQPDFSSTPGMDFPLCATVNVIFTQLKYLRYLPASDPGLRCESGSQRETDEWRRWREELNQCETLCGHAGIQMCKRACVYTGEEVLYHMLQNLSLQCTQHPSLSVIHTIHTPLRDQM